MIKNLSSNLLFIVEKCTIDNGGCDPSALCRSPHPTAVGEDVECYCDSGLQFDSDGRTCTAIPGKEIIFPYCSRFGIKMKLYWHTFACRVDPQRSILAEAIGFIIVRVYKKILQFQLSVNLFSFSAIFKRKAICKMSEIFFRVIRKCQNKTQKFKLKKNYKIKIFFLKS